MNYSFILLIIFSTWVSPKCLAQNAQPAANTASNTTMANKAEAISETPNLISHEQHWHQIQCTPDKETILEHLQRFPLCKHHQNAILMLCNSFPYPAIQEGSAANTRPGDMVFVKGDSFMMGGNDWESHSNETPVHQVSLSDFYIGKFEVTFAEYDAFCRAIGRRQFSDHGWGRERRPAVNINWFDAIEYCNWLSEQHDYEKVYTINLETVTANWEANGFRLPTEAEWEFAARSRGQDDKWAGTSSESELMHFANYWESQENDEDGFPFTAPVKSFSGNELGLHDMSGNAWEWCWDWYDDNYYKKSKGAQNPKGAKKGTVRIRRGGSWALVPASLRCANRYYCDPHLRYRVNGFRLAMSAGDTKR